MRADAQNTDPEKGVPHGRLVSVKAAAPDRVLRIAELP